MRRLLDDFGAVAAIAGLLLLAMLTLTLGGAFDALSESQSAFLGTLAGATVGFLGLLAGALYNAHLNRQLALEDEAKRQASCLLMLHHRVRSFAVTAGLLARVVENSKHIAVENVEAFEMAAKSLAHEDFPDLRLIDSDVLSEVYELHANVDGTRFTVVGPIKLCPIEDAVFVAHDQAVAAFAEAIGALCDDAIRLRKKVSKARGVTDVGPANYAEMNPKTIIQITK